MRDILEAFIELCGMTGPEWAYLAAQFVAVAATVATIATIAICMAPA